MRLLHFLPLYLIVHCLLDAFRNYKSAFITPLIKKPGLDPADARSYQPIANLSVVSKLLERFVARQLHCYLQSSNLLPSSQSAYRPFHPTKTAVLRVLSDLLLAVDQSEVAALVLLDLSAACRYY